MLYDRKCRRFIWFFDFVQDDVTQGAPNSTWLDLLNNAEFEIDYLAQYSLRVIWSPCVRVCRMEVMMMVNILA